MNKYAKTLEKGDLIVVPYNNYIHPAIYAGQGNKGKGENPQFYTLHLSMTDCVSYWSELERSLNRRRKPYKSSINRPTSSCIAKLSIEELSDEYAEIYEFTKIKLKKLNLI